MRTDTSVLIVGGSLNGLTTALLLARRGVSCVVVERHPGTTLQYKFRGISPRSMEIYRSLGIEDEIRARDSIDDASAYVARTKNLADGDVSWQGIPWSDTSDISPTAGATCDQDQLEPILRAHAERLGVDVRFNTELIDFTQDPEGVTVRVHDRVSGQDRAIRASYLVGADGTSSPVREALGIARHGPGTLQHWMNVIFETDLLPTLDGRPLRAVLVTDINGTFVPRGDGRWLMAVQYVPERGERPEDFTHEHCRELVRRAAGRSDVGVRIVDTRSWEAAAAVADRYQDGRVFLVGDSAHVMPPTGGFGGNTGIQDAYNLAWKLDAVTRGAAGPGLLDTYDQERRPTADSTVAQAVARLQAWFKDPGQRLPPPVAIIRDEAVIFGYRYGLGAFAADGHTAPQQAFEDPRDPSGLPGSRAPQLRVECDGEQRSTIDLFAGRWVLMAGPDGGPWRDVVDQLAPDNSFGLSCHRLGDAGLRDIESRWSTRYGAERDGAVLIRPDGFIAWRGCDSATNTQRSLAVVLDFLTFRRQAHAS